MTRASQRGLFDELIIDNFAGGGGASHGIEMALNRPIDIAVNHDQEAVAMHNFILFGWWYELSLG